MEIPGYVQLKQTYSQYSNDEVLQIAAGSDALTVPARDALKLEMQKRGLEPQLRSSERSIQAPPNTSCKFCGIEGPTMEVRFSQNIGMFITRTETTMTGYLCRPCIGRVFRSYTLTTLFLGWWGLLSMLMTPVILFSNVAQYLRARKLPDPGIGAMDRPFGLTPPPVASGSFAFKLIYGVIICSIGLGALAYYQVTLMEKFAPSLNATLHKGEITNEADGEYAGLQVGKDIAALETDIKSKDWSGIRSELLAREPNLQDLNAQNSRLQERLQVERDANMGANDACENLFITEWAPDLNDYTVALNNLFSFARSNPTLTEESRNVLILLSDRETTALKKLQDFYSQSDSRGCSK